MKALFIEDQFFKGCEMIIDLKKGLHEDIGTNREGLLELLIFILFNVIDMKFQKKCRTIKAKSKAYPAALLSKISNWK